MASDFANSNEKSESRHGSTPSTPQARRPVVAQFKYGSPTELQRRGVTGVLAHP
jgi:hypothetical protein